MATASLEADDILSRLRTLLPADSILTDDDNRRFYATDIYATRKLPLAVVLPCTVEQVQAIVRACAEFRSPIAIRGGGASYTDGYTHNAARGITLSTERLCQILEIDEQDATVTVEAGVTWKQLHEALAPLGWRTPFFGPFSGLHATIGGGLSQNSVSHGSAAHGSAAESLLSLEIVTGTGDLLQTGSAGSANPDPFFRHFGPDMAGLFTGDCGALGIKARITLRMIRSAPAVAFASFRFDTFEALHTTMRAIAIEKLDDEHFAIDAVIQQGQLDRQTGVNAKLGIAQSVMANSGSFLSGVATLAKMAVGTEALKVAPYVGHWTLEGVTEAEADARLDRLRTLAKSHGEEIPPTVPTVARAMPFAPFTNTLGAQGERWVPIHGIFPHSRVQGFHHALQALLRSNQPALDEHAIRLGAMFLCPAPNAFLYEPCFYWPDARSIYHDRTVPREALASLPAHPANPAAANEVKRLKSEIADLMHTHGAAHFQIGRTYAYARGRNAASLLLLRAVKTAMDPHYILSPGALGL